MNPFRSILIKRARKAYAEALEAAEAARARRDTRSIRYAQDRLTEACNGLLKAEGRG